MFASVPVPIEVLPSKKDTVPVAFAVPDAGCTVAESCTHWPKDEGFEFEVTLVVVAAWVMVSVIALDVLPLRFAFPPYTAVMLWDPAARKDTVS